MLQSADGRSFLSTSADIESLEWTKIPRGGALNVRQEGKPTSVFVGFREQARGNVKRLGMGRTSSRRVAWLHWLLSADVEHEDMETETWRPTCPN